jgi:hypothetical protein
MRKRTLTLILSALSFLSWLLTTPSETKYVQSMNIFKAQTYLYYQSMGVWPNTLEELITQGPVIAGTSEGDLDITVSGQRITPVIVGTNANYQYIKLQGDIGAYSLGEMCRNVKLRTRLNMDDVKIIDCTASKHVYGTAEPLYRFTINISIRRPDVTGASGSKHSDDRGLLLHSVLDFTQKPAENAGAIGITMY